VKKSRMCTPPFSSRQSRYWALVKRGCAPQSVRSKLLLWTKSSNDSTYSSAVLNALPCGNGSSAPISSLSTFGHTQLRRPELDEDEPNDRDLPLLCSISRLLIRLL